MPLFDLTTPAAVQRIRQRNGALRAYVTTRLDEALAEATALQRQAPRSTLHGVPYGLKDEWDTAGIRTTGGSWRHRDRVPEHSSPVYELFQAAGAVLVGKTNLSDMGLAPESTSYVAGSVRNPWDLRCTAGGSSGGAAAAVADGMQAFDWGTDIGGSIRLPAAFCGVLGLRLSSETWPIVGLFPMPPPALAWLCGQGPITQTVAQMRVLLQAAAPLRTGRARSFAARGVVLYPPRRPGRWPTFSTDVRSHLRAAVDADLRPAPLPDTVHTRGVYSALWASHLEDLLTSDSTITLAEGLRAVLSAVLLRGRFGDRRFSPGTARLLGLMALGRHTIYRDRRKALQQAGAIRAAFGSCWNQGYVVVAPVCSYPAPRLGRLDRRLDALSSTIPGNISDATGLAVPFGRFANGLPRAIQLMGPPGSEETLLDLAERLIRSRDTDPALRPDAQARA